MWSTLMYCLLLSDPALRWDSPNLYNDVCIVVYSVPPPRDDTLPDLYRLMDSLEEGETDLVTKRDPPALFTREEHVPKYEKISGNL